MSDLKPCPFCEDPMKQWELEAKLQSMALDCLAADGQAADAYQAQLAAEAKLVKAKQFIVFLDENYRHAFGDTARQKIRELYAELRGEKGDE